MRPVHYITIIVSSVLVWVLFRWGNTAPPKEDSNISVATPSHAPAQINADSLIKVSKADLPNHAQETITALEHELSALKDSVKMAPLFEKLADVWLEHKRFLPVAYYHMIAARLENSEKKLNFAAQLFLDLARRADDAALQAWEGQMAISGFSRVLELNSDNDTAKVHLAECYIGTGETMQGVLLLREVTEKNPDNIPANLILGQQGIVSGQLDKAIARFETVLRQEPKNLEAILGMAEALKNKGDKTKAIALLEQAKELMNHPGFSKDIDEYIKSFK